MSNIVATAEQDAEEIFDKLVDHFKALISFAGSQRDRLNTVASDVNALADKVETDIMGKLDGLEDTIRDAVTQPIMDKIAAVEADLGQQIAALTASTTGAAAPTTTTVGSTTITVDPAAGTTTAVDASAGTTTTLDHTTGATTTTDASGATVQPDPATVQAAQNATTAAGVTAASA